MNAKKLRKRAEDILLRAAADGRDVTAEERREALGLLAEAKQIERGEAEVKGILDGGNGNVRTFSPDGAVGGDLGSAFIASDGYRRVKDSSTRGQTFTTGAIEVPHVMTKGTLLEGTGSPGLGTGGGFLPVPQVRPGVVQKLLSPPLGVADLLGQALATGNTVRYVVEGTATSGATGVAEAGAKPESTIALSTVDEPVKKIATSLVVSDEVLDDAAAAQGFVNGELTRFCKLEEEEQILRGGGGNDIAGLVGRAGVNAYNAGTVDNNAVALAKVIANTRGSSFVEPDAIVMSPANWLATRLLTDSTGQFLGDGPFGAPAGGGGPGLWAGQTLWNKPVVLSDVIGAGTALVGNFGAAATLYRRGGVTVEATNSHQDYFTKDLVAFRAEQREALAVYYPGAFTVVSGLD